MTERLQTIAKTLIFYDPVVRGSSVLYSDSSKICFHPDQYYVSLKQQSDGKYSTDAGIFVVTERVLIRSVREFLALEVEISHVRVEGVVVTSHRLRLHDGTDQFYWKPAVAANPLAVPPVAGSPAAWTKIVTGEEWNTEDEVSVSLASFKPASKTLGVVINLRTTDSSVTPVVHYVKLAASVRSPSTLEDILARSLVAKMRTDIRPLAELSFTLPADTDEIDLGAFLADKTIPKPAFVVTDVEGVFLSRLEDPDQSENLLEAYDSGDKVISLSKTFEMQKKVLISVVYAPPVALWRQSVDYYKPKVIPEVVITQTMAMEGSQLPGGELQVRRGNERLIIRAPYRYSLQCSVMGFSPSAKDEARLGDELLAFFQDNEILEGRATGDRYRLQVMQEFQDMTEDGYPAEVCTGTMTFKIHNLLLYRGGHRTQRLVQELHVGGDFSVIVTS